MTLATYHEVTSPIPLFNLLNLNLNISAPMASSRLVALQAQLTATIERTSLDQPEVTTTESVRIFYHFHTDIS